MSDVFTREEFEATLYLLVQPVTGPALAAKFSQELLGHDAALRAQLAQMTLERDLAIAHDRQPYPTAHAYEQVCKALESHKRQLAEREAQIKELEARVSPDTSSTPHADESLPPDYRNVP